ncbi:MAG: aminoacyl-tRNA hydrolase [Polyangiaceae bacterium]|nr:aminoacyl-tRNA hydrolase [Polyangiaceae bacterium]
MLLVVGLGNPGKSYEDTRHNVGFAVVDALARAANADPWRDKFSASLARGRVGTTDLALLKPQTFMNLSGQSVQPAAAFFKVPAASVLIVHDELDLPFGDLRLKLGGGHAGHNGLRSIIERMGTPDFGRLRVGIGRPPPGFRGDVASYVLSRFDPVERASLGDLYAAALKALEAVAASGLSAAMNRLNARPRPAPPRGGGAGS